MEKDKEQLQGSPMWISLPGTEAQAPGLCLSLIRVRGEEETVTLASGNVSGAGSQPLEAVR